MAFLGLKSGGIERICRSYNATETLGVIDAASICTVLPYPADLHCRGHVLLNVLFLFGPKASGTRYVRGRKLLPPCATEGRRGYSQCGKVQCHYHEARRSNDLDTRRPPDGATTFFFFPLIQYFKSSDENGCRERVREIHRGCGNTLFHVYITQS